MHCHNHHNSEAVQLCANCLKGLCQECSLKAPHCRGRIACSNDCHTELSQLAEINEKAKVIYGIGHYGKKTNFASAAIFFVLMGLFALMSGLYSAWKYGYISSFDIFFMSFGTLLIVFGILRHLRSKQIGIDL